MSVFSLQKIYVVILDYKNIVKSRIKQWQHDIRIHRDSRLVKVASF